MSLSDLFEVVAWPIEIHRGRSGLHVACGAGFDFDETEHVFVPANQINFPMMPGGPKIARDHDVAAAPEVEIRVFLATPAGRLAWTVRVQRMGISSPAMTRLLAEQGYEIVRESRAQSWFLRKDAPPALLERMKGARVLTRGIAE